jgi:hypothetical protein
MGGIAFHGEIEAFARLTGAEPDPFEVDMLRMLYRVQMASIDKKSKTSPKDQPKAEVAVSDGAGVVGFMRGLGAKKKG